MSCEKTAKLSIFWLLCVANSTKGLNPEALLINCARQRSGRLDQVISPGEKRETLMRRPLTLRAQGAHSSVHTPNLTCDPARFVAEQEQSR